MRVLNESVGFLPENGRFSLRIKGIRLGNTGRFRILEVSVVFGAIVDSC